MIELEEKEKKVLLALIEGIPLTKTPFTEIGKKLGLEEKEVVEIIKKLKEKKVIRRLGATLRHNKAGYTANAMVAWYVPEEKVEEIGSELAKNPLITHCYLRKTYSDWKYNLYTMIHARSEDELNKIIKEISERFELYEYQVLPTVKEVVRKHAVYKF